MPCTKLTWSVEQVYYLSVKIALLITCCGTVSVNGWLFSLCTSILVSDTGYITSLYNRYNYELWETSSRERLLNYF